MLRKLTVPICVFIMMTSSFAFCAKLIDDELPGEKTLFGENQTNAEATVAKKSQTKVPDSVYVQFETKIKKLGPNGLAKIDTYFRNLQEKAEKDNDEPKAVYYTKLLTIIDKYKKGK